MIVKNEIKSATCLEKGTVADLFISKDYFTIRQMSAKMNLQNSI